MRFKHILVTADGSTDDRLNEPWEITFKGRADRRVLCRNLRDDEIAERAVKRPGVYVEASATFRVRPKIDDVLLCLEKRRVPSDIPTDAKVQEQIRTFIGEDGLLKNQVLPLSLMPAYFQEFQHNTTQGLGNLAKDGFRLLRWRLALERCPDHFLTRGSIIRGTIVFGECPHIPLV
jgi:hypothetical protein